MLGFWGVLLVLLVNYTLCFNREVVYTKRRGGGGGSRILFFINTGLSKKNGTVETTHTALRF